MNYVMWNLPHLNELWVFEETMLTIYERDKTQMERPIKLNVLWNGTGARTDSQCAMNEVIDLYKNCP